MNPFRRSFAVLFVLAVLLVPAAAFADHAGSYHWARTANPFTLKTYDSLTAAWDPYLSVAASDWSQSAVLDVAVQWNQPFSGAKRCTSTTGAVEICNAYYGSTGWIGISGLTLSGTHITKAYTKLNDTYFDTTTYNSWAWRQLVVCRELGRVLGLAAQDNSTTNANLGSCMDATNDPDGGAGGAAADDPSNEHPNAHDYATLEQIYAHLDGTSTVAAALGTMAATLSRPQSVQELVARAGQWGAPIRFDAQGLPTAFAMPVPNDAGGHDLAITYVFWAPVDPFAEEDRTPEPGGLTDH